MNRTRFSATGAAVIVAVLLSACSSGGEPASSEPTVAPLTIDDFKSSPDRDTRRFNDPSDLGVSEEWESITGSLSFSLTKMLESSFAEPSTWKLASDEDAVDAVALEFGTIGEENAASLSKALLAQTRSKAVEGERVATRYASTFAPNMQPSDVYIYKIAWNADVDKKTRTVKVTAVVWAGYQLEAGPVIVARQFSLSGKDEGPNVAYSMDTPVFGGYYDLCSVVADGVLAPNPDEIPEKEAEALRKEMADNAFRPLREAVEVISKADGTSDSDDDRSQRVEACLAGS